VKLFWTAKALGDLDRLYRFLAPANPRAAAGVVRQLSAAPQRLLENPRLGLRLEEFGSREVRRIVIGSYEIRYQIAGEEIIVLRLFHAREDR